MQELMIKLNMVDDVKLFIEEVTNIDADVDLQKNRYVVDAKSIMGVFTLDLSEPVKVVIHSDDESLIETFKRWVV